jgi:mannose-6-phosphate isomerase-like protein (cupin superfamily)
MADFTAKRIDDMEGIYGGAFKRARAELGVTSFGMQVFDMPPNADRHPEHDHSDEGQEEVYLVLRGSGEVEVDGERVALDPEMIVRVGPAARRKLYAGPDGMRLLALGGVPGKPYEISDITELGGPNPSLS